MGWRLFHATILSGDMRYGWCVIWLVSSTGLVDDSENQFMFSLKHLYRADVYTKILLQLYQLVYKRAGLETVDKNIIWNTPH